MGRGPSLKPWHCGVMPVTSARPREANDLRGRRALAGLAAYFHESGATRGYQGDFVAKPTGKTIWVGAVWILPIGILAFASSRNVRVQRKTPQVFAVPVSAVTAQS